MDLRSTYNKIAESWFESHKNDTWWVEGVNKFISFLKPGDSVLDVGCGNGTKSKYMLEKGLDVIGIDFSEKMVEIAKREVPKGKFRVLDIKDIEQLKEEFDGVFAQAVLLHFPKKQVKDIIHGLLSKLKPEGYLYIAVKEKPPGGQDEETEKKTDFGYSYERFYSYFTMEEMKGYLQELDMEISYFKNVVSERKDGWIQIIGHKL